MCGIFGVFGNNADRPCEIEVLRRMGEVLTHRGPDGGGLYTEGGLGIGMRRLSIIDLKTGDQPMANEDRTIWVVYNGEIYNYRELTAELVAKGHRFATTSDTEVLVHLYEEHGEACVDRLHGMFAFAIWDTLQRKLFLARDRLGIKPLYYAETQQGFVFGSELKAVIQSPWLARQVNPRALLAYLQYGYVPDPLSIFQNISKLPPGHFLVVGSKGQAEAKRYWDPAPFLQAPSRLVSEQALLEELRWRLTQSVKEHLVSDVPVGAFLSGGIDSSTVVALMSAEVGRPIKTFSIGFREEPYNELPYARLVAERIGTEHHELIIGPQSMDILDQVVGYFDEPFADASAIPTYFVSLLARDHVKVVLSGDGGDEIFAGYDRYVVDYRRRGYDIISRLGASGLVRWVGETLPEGSYGKNYLINISLPRMDRYLDSISHFPLRMFRQLLSGDILAELNHSDSDVFTPHIAESQNLDFQSRLQYVDQKTYLPGDILTKVDRMTMAHSLEARVPLLDHKLVEFVAAVPSRYKLRDGETKYLFKRAMDGLIPSEIRFRKKQGFAVPLVYWFRDGVQDYFQQQLLSDNALEHGYFNRTFVEKLFNLYIRTGKPVYLQRLWTLLVFELWHRACVSGK